MNNAVNAHACARCAYAAATIIFGHRFSRQVLHKFLSLREYVRSAAVRGIQLQHINVPLAAEVSSFFSSRRDFLLYRMWMNEAYQLGCSVRARPKYFRCVSRAIT